MQLCCCRSARTASSTATYMNGGAGKPVSRPTLQYKHPGTLLTPSPLDMAMSRRTISEYDSEVPERGYQRGRGHEWDGKSPLRLRASTFPPPQSADEADSARFSRLTGWRWTW